MRWKRQRRVEERQGRAVSHQRPRGRRGRAVGQVGGGQQHRPGAVCGADLLQQPGRVEGGQRAVAQRGRRLAVPEKPAEVPPELRPQPGDRKRK